MVDKVVVRVDNHNMDVLSRSGELTIDELRSVLEKCVPQLKRRIANASRDDLEQLVQMIFQWHRRKSRGGLYREG